MSSPAGYSPRRVYRIMAVAEMVTWALLIVGMIAKYIVKVGDWPVQVFGLLHGIVFISYVFTAVIVGINQHWRVKHLVTAVGSAVIPFVTLPFDRWLEGKRMLDGDWRREKTPDPRDHTPVSAGLRFSLRYPIPLLIVGVIAVFAVVLFLLWLGPPTQWFSE